MARSILIWRGVSPLESAGPSGSSEIFLLAGLFVLMG